MTTNFDQIQAGWTAYDQGNDKIGEVAEVGRNYVLVQKGLFFPTDLYIPFSFVTGVDANDASLTINATKSDVESYGWDSPPTADTEGTKSDWDLSTDRTLGGTAAGSTMGGATTTDEDTLTVPLREERVQAERREREAGEVTVGTHVVEQEETLDVPVTHEEVEITRRRVDRPDDGAGITDDGTTIRVPVRSEEVDVRKDSRGVEEVEISKRPVTETKRVSETVRREELDVDTSDELVTGAGVSRSTRANVDDDTLASGSRLDDEDPYRTS